VAVPPARRTAPPRGRLFPALPPRRRRWVRAVHDQEPVGPVGTGRDGPGAWAGGADAGVGGAAVAPPARPRPDGPG